jgi:hypothetical protein
VPRSGPRLKICLPAILYSAIAGLYAEPSRALAGGCHAPDRPVLTRSLSWEPRHRADRSVSLFMAPAPPVLVPMPCPGETPSLPSFATGFLEALLAMEALQDPPTAGYRIAIRSLSPINPLIASRLDRPPRQASGLLSRAD